MATKKKKEPWDKATPARSKHTKLSPASKAKARAKAKRAGRHYPNLVDNMQVAKEQRRSKSKKKS